MAKFEFIKQGVPITKAREMILRIPALTKKELKPLGARTRDKMRNVIRSKKKRNQAGEIPKLERTINVNHFENGWGVGNIDLLNKNAPYWYWQNFGFAQSGRRRPPPVTGHFEPENKGRIKQKAPWIRYVPKRDLQPMDYIEITIHWLGKQIAKKMAKVSRSIR